MGASTSFQDMFCLDTVVYLPPLVGTRYVGRYSKIYYESHTQTTYVNPIHAVPYIKPYFNFFLRKSKFYDQFSRALPVILKFNTSLCSSFSSMSSNASAGVPSATTTSLIVVSAIFPVLSGVATYFRFRLHGKSTAFVADDLWLFVTWVSTLCLSILVWVVAKRSGINHYTIDSATGTKYSLAVSANFP